MMRSLLSHKRFSLAAKFNLLTISLVLATATGICVFMIRLEMNAYYQELLSHGKTIADTTAKNCEFGMYTENEAVLLPILDGLAVDSEIAYVSVLSNRQRTIAFRVFKGTGGLLRQTVPIKKGTPSLIYRDIREEQDGQHYIDILCPLLSGGQIELQDASFKGPATEPQPLIIGYVRLGLLQEGLQNRIRRLVFSAVLFTSFLVLIGTGLTILLSRKITFPLKRLIKATKDISEGNFDTSFSTRTTDEIFDLSSSFNHMRKSLQAYHAQAEERIAEEQRHLLEKEKLMMDLHDGIGGITTNIGILAELARKAPDMASIQETLAIISRLSQDGVSEIRSFMQSLDSKELNWPALAAELKKQGATLVEPHHIQFIARTSVDDVHDQPGSLLWVNVLRIYKEALTNVIKHSKATTVTVTLRISRTGLSLSIQDDGIGWDDKVSTGRGLPNMKKRASEIGGCFTISAREGAQGALICLEVPFPVQYAMSVGDM